MTKRERKSTEKSGYRGHHDGAKAKQTCLEDGVSRVLTLHSLRQEREVNHHDRVLFNNSYEQDDADDGDHVQLALEENQGKDGSDTRGRQSGKDRNWVHQTLIQAPQHDVDRKQRHHDENDLVDERLLEISSCAGKAATDSSRHRQPLLQLLDGDSSLFKRDPWRQIEGHSHCGEKPVVVDREWRSRVCRSDEGVQRNAVSTRGMNINRFHPQGALRILRGCLHDYVILIQRCIDCGDLRLPKGSIERLIDELWRDAQT